jgi:3-phosphoglycerate kinase
MAVQYIDQLQLAGKKVLIRVDYNVPFDENRNITDDTRISATLPTIEHCVKQGAITILVSHVGRPKGAPEAKYSLKPVAPALSAMIRKEVIFVDKLIGEGAEDVLASLKPGDIALLENIRFYPGEEKNDAEFGKKLASLCDVYINDAFATAHRGHASNDAITKAVKEKAAGFLLKDEIEYFNKAMSNPKRPLTAIIGGAKVSSKLAALNNVLEKVDMLIIGGGMAFTFLKAQGHNVGKSLLEEDLLGTAKEIMDKAAKKGVKILLPVDVVCAAEFKNDAPSKTVAINAIPDDMMGLDAGPQSVELFKKAVAESKTIVWNGPMGVFEMPSFAVATNAIANAIAEADCLSIVGGGDSVSAINQSGVADKISYISTGGGAFLELLEGKVLPGIAALEQ